MLIILLPLRIQGAPWGYASSKLDCSESSFQIVMSLRANPDNSRILEFGTCIYIIKVLMNANAQQSCSKTTDDHFDLNTTLFVYIIAD